MYEDPWTVPVILVIGTLIIAGFPGRSTLLRTGLVAALAVANVYYFHWRIQAWRFHSAAFLAYWFQLTYFAFEILAISYDLFSCTTLLRRTDRTREAHELAARLSQEVDKPEVCILVPSYNEHHSIVLQSLRSLCEQDYPSARLTIVLCDDGKIKADDPAAQRERMIERRRCIDRGIQQLADQGANVLSIRRRDSAHGKAGNLNAAFADVRVRRADFICVFDADFIAFPNCIQLLTAALFYKPHLGVVQCPQTFRSPEITALNLNAPWSICENQNFFMNVVQPARDAVGAAFCIGSVFCVRRELLDRLGKFPDDALSEDLLLTLAGISLGYETRFIALKLAHGLAPQSIGELVVQQCRWAQGSVQAFLHAYGPLHNPKMTWTQRLQFTETVVYWLGFITLALMLSAPAIYFLVGIPAVPNQHGAGMEIVVLRLLAREIILFLFTSGRVAPILTTVSKAAVCWPVAAAVVSSFLAPSRKFRFHVTDKPIHARIHESMCWPVALPLLAIWSITIIGVAANVLGFACIIPKSDLSSTSVLWTAWSLTILGLAILTCVDQPWDPANDSPHREAHRFEVWQTAAGLIKRLWE